MLPRSINEFGQWTTKPDPLYSNSVEFFEFDDALADTFKTPPVQAKQAEGMWRLPYLESDTVEYFHPIENVHTPNKNVSIDIMCENIQKHVRQCKHCRYKLGLTQSSGYLAMRQDLLDLITWILIGIFILLLIHILKK